MLQRGKDAQWEKRDSLTVYLGTNLQAEKRGNEMIKTYGKRILSGVLTGCMLLGLMPGLEGLIPSAAALNTIGESFGFDSQVPDGYDENGVNDEDKENPYGMQAANGQVNFNPVSELNIFMAESGSEGSVSYNIDSSSVGSYFTIPSNQPNGGGSTSFSKSGTTAFSRSGLSMRYVSGTAFDPDGDGRANYVAYYGFDSGDGYRPKLYIADANQDANEAFSNGWYGVSEESTTENFDLLGELDYQEYEGYSAITAGDFDGDGEETVILYYPLYQHMALLETDGTVHNNEWQTNRVLDIGSSSLLGEYFGLTPNAIQRYRDKASARTRNTPMIHLAAGNVDNDDADELIVTVSLNNLEGEDEDDLKSRASVLMVLDQQDDGAWGVSYSKQMESVYVQNEENGNSHDESGGWYMRSAASRVGDIDGDGEMEIITAGLPFDDRNADSDDIGEEGAIVSITDCMGTGYNTRMTRNTADTGRNPATVIQGWKLEFTGDTGLDYYVFTTSHADEGPVSLASVAFEGTGTQEYAVVQGQIFKYSGRPNGADGSFTRYSYQIQDPIARVLSGTNIISQPIVGNFDGNDKGREQVFFLTSYEGGIYRDPFYLGGYYYNGTAGDLLEGSGMYGCNWKLPCDTSGWSFAALAAVDADTNDGLLAHFENKSYEFSDVEVMAVLEATPYFEDLSDEYSETMGATSFGVSTGSGSGQSQTSSTSAGTYVSFEQEVGIFGANVASFEMETALESEWSTETSTETEWTYGMNFDAGRDSHRVVLIQTPAIVYNYTVTDPATGATTEMHLSQAQMPAYTSMSLEKYNELAASVGMTDQIIDDSVLPSIPGQPTSYRTDTTGLNNPVLYGSYSRTDSGSSVTSQSIDSSTSTAITTSQSHSVEVSGGAGAFGLTIGGSGGSSSETARSETNTSAVTRQGTVADVPSEYGDRYGFQWQFLTWDIELGSDKNAYSVPVLGYIVQDVSQPPSLPKNIEVSPVTEEDGTAAIDLAWEAGYIPAAKYEIYRYIEADPSGQHYHRIATVSGSETVFRHTGLQPGTTYSYCMRAIDKNGVATGYSEPVAVVTSANDGSQPRILNDPADATVRAGESAKFTVNAIPGSGGGGLTFTWQSRAQGGGWHQLSGAASDSTLQLTNVTEDMNGMQYRCMVSSLGGNENVAIAYSEPATLTVTSGDSTTTALSLSAEGGAADTSIPTNGTRQETVNTTYQVTIGEETTPYLRYSNIYATQPDCVYQNLSDGEYYLLPGFTASSQPDDTGTVTATADSAEPLESLRGMLLNGSALVASIDDLHSTIQQTETMDITSEDQTGKEYQVYTAQGGAVEDSSTTEAPVTTLTMYENRGTYYVDVDGDGLLESGEAMTANHDPYDRNKTSITNMQYFADTLEPVWSSGYETTEDGYTILSDGNDGDATVYRKSAGDGTEDYYQKVGGEYILLTQITADWYGTTEQGAVTVQAQPGNPDTTEIEVPTSGTEVKKGAEVTLTAAVDAAGDIGGNNVTFTITNTATGRSQMVTANVSGKTATAKWTPPAAGVYTITARYNGGSDSLPSMSETMTYYAVEQTEAEGGTKPVNVLELTGDTFGDEISASLSTWSSDTEATAPVEDVTYKAYPYLGIGVAGADDDGYSTTPVEDWENGNNLLPNRYKICAYQQDGGTQLASCLLTVSKRAVTIAAPELEDIPLEEAGSYDLAAQLERISVTDTGTGAGHRLIGSYGEADAGYPDLFRLTSDLAGQAGQYRVDVSYAEDSSAEQEDFLSKYVPTFQSGTVNVVADTATVTYSAGTNGTLQAYNQTDGSPIATGTTVPVGSTINFVATPTAGFAVASWTVNEQPITDEVSGITIIPNENALTVDLTQYSTGGGPLNVEVAFTNQNHTVTYSVTGANGTLTAAQNGTEINSGTSVAQGSAVTFTAHPAENYVVKQWTVQTGTEAAEAQLNPDNQTPYTGTTLTLDAISADTEVAVEFEQSALYDVSYAAVDSSGAPATGVTFTVEGLTDGRAVKGSNVTFHATATPGVVIQAWQVKRGESADWTTASESANSFTLYNVQENTEVRAVVNTGAASTYTLTFGVVDEAGQTVSNGGTLTAKSSDAALTSGQSYPANIRADFTFTEADAYEVVGWTVNGDDVQAGRDKLAYTLENLASNTTVNVVVKAKPQVMFTAQEGGTLSAKADVSPIQSGDYVYNGTGLTFTAEPVYGFEVDTWIVNAVEQSGTPTETDAQTFTLTADNSEDVSVEVRFKEIPQYEVAYSVYDTNGSADGGTNGTLSASAERKNMDDYRVDALASGATVYRDSVVTFTAQPASGYRVQEWRINDSVYEVDGLPYIGTELPVKVTDADMEIVVQFVQIGNMVTAAAGSGGDIVSAKVGEEELIDNIENGFVLHENASVVFTVEPDPGYEVDYWTVNGAQVTEGVSNDGLTFTYTTDSENTGAAIGVRFRQVTYPVSWSGTNATVTASVSGNSSAAIRGGTEVTFTAQPEEGYTVTEWTVNGISADASGNTFTWTVPNGMAANPQVEQYEIVAVCGRGSYPVTMVQPAHGRLRADRDDLSAVPGGTAVTFTAVPNENYIVAGWIVNDTTVDSRNNTYTVTVNGPATVTAVIVPSHYAVSFSVDGGHGAIAAGGYQSSPASVAYGEDIVFTATPDAYYQVSEWLVDGKAVTSGVSADRNTFTLSDVTGAHAVTVRFSNAVSYQVSYAVSGTGGTVSATVNGEPLILDGNTAQVPGNSTLVFTAVPDSGRMLKGWTVNGEAVDNLTNTLTIDRLTEQTHIVAEFEPYVGFTIPGSGAGYTVSDIVRDPAETCAGAPENEIRLGGDVRFVVTPAEGTVITELSVAGGSAVQNADGTWTVTVENVQQKIVLSVSTAEGIPLVISAAENGTITVERRGEQLASGAALQIGDELVITAAADSGYRLDALTVNGESFRSGSTFTVQQDMQAVTVEATFVQSGGAAGGGGGGAVTETFDITLPEDIANGTVTVSPERAQAGETVTITVDPDAGYTLDKLTVSDADGNGIALTNAGNGAYAFAMPESDVQIDVSFTEQGQMQPLPFEDVLPEAWYYDAVQYVYENGMMNGISETAFGPDVTTSRAMIVTILHRLENEPEAPAAGFTDVAAGTYYADAVAWAAANGIVTGVSETVFAPDNAITREQMAAILYRYAQFKGWDVTAGSGLSAYADASRISAYAVEAMRWANAEGLITGVTDTALEPQDSATRAQVATILMRFCENIAK